ncbi:MAG TPA: phosphomannomutase/phosphoglucomutase, partial [Geminicoccaceae bacterium]|nr:phosphomannomutase/phosphoglucomutase [Geminicoccaceae bacterium]
ALADGLCRSGVEVHSIGRGPTPMMYFAVHHLGADGGLQVTGSHNPPSHNGFKMMLGTKPLYGAQIQELGQLAAEGAFTDEEGSLHDAPVLNAYVDRLLRDFRPGRPLRVVWDAGNGATGEVLRAVAARLPGRHELLFADIDGRFPNHHPDPTIPANLADLIAAVRGGGADLGIAFDGDGDRIGVVDGEGRIMFGDQLMQILAADVLARHPGAPILADVKASQALFDEIARLGGQPVMGKTGHSLMKIAMAEMGAPLAGEMSGHIFYADGFYGHDDAVYVAIRLLGILGTGDPSLAQRRDRMVPMVNTPELRFDCPDEQKFAVIDEVKARLAAEGAAVNAIDGVRVSTADGWWLLRASNTQAVLVARAEARDQAGLERLMRQIAANLRAAGVEPPAFTGVEPPAFTA